MNAVTNFDQLFGLEWTLMSMFIHEYKILWFRNKKNNDNNNLPSIFKVELNIHFLNIFEATILAVKLIGV